MLAISDKVVLRLLGEAHSGVVHGNGGDFACCGRRPLDSWAHSKRYAGRKLRNLTATLWFNISGTAICIRLDSASQSIVTTLHYSIEREFSREFDVHLDAGCRWKV